MTLSHTALYAALLTVIFIVLTQLVIRVRSKARIPLGDAGDFSLLEASRRQVNFAENVPLTLILMALAEAGGASSLILNLAGGLLVLARLIHPFGITTKNGAHPARIAGAVATTIVQLGLVVVLILQHFV